MACAPSANSPYRAFITQELPKHEYFSDLVRNQLIYYPTVTREPFIHQGRITELAGSSSSSPTSVCRHSTRRPTAR